MIHSVHSPLFFHVSLRSLTGKEQRVNWTPAQTRGAGDGGALFADSLLFFGVEKKKRS